MQTYEYAADPIDELLDRDFESEGDALAALVHASRWIHAEMASRDIAADEPRLKPWLDRLIDSTRKVANTFGAEGFSVTVGWPAGSSVSLTWKTGSP